MRKVLVAITAIIVASILLMACSDQERAKYYGGSATIDLPKGEKLVTVTWKDNADIWYLTRPMTPKDSAETYYFRQSKGDIISFTGDGLLTIVESK